MKYKYECQDYDNAGNICCTFIANFKCISLNKPAFCPNCGSDEYVIYIGKDE